MDDKKIPIIIGGITVLVGSAALIYLMTRPKSIVDAPKTHLNSLVSEIPYQIPGPTPDDNGNMKAIVAAGGLVPFVRNMHEEYGYVCQFYLGANNPVISINDPQLLMNTLKMGSRPIEMFKFLEPLLGPDNLQIYDGDRAAKFRRLTNPAFGHQVLSSKYEDILKLALEITDHLNSFAEKDTVLIQSELLKFGLKAIIKVALSSEALEDLDLHKFNDSYDTVLSGVFDRQYSALTSTREQEFQEALAYVKSAFGTMIEKRKQQKSTTPNAVLDACDLLLSADDPHTGKPFTDEAIMSLLSGFLLAAYHTSAISVAWTIYELTQHPEVQRKGQEEVDAILKGKSPTLDDIDKMTYINQIIKESMRMNTPGPFAARLVDEEVDISGYKLAKGTTLFYPLSAIHKNSEYWPEPEKFDPERFTPEKVKKMNPLSYCPFGLGARICPGERLAWLEMRLLLALLLQRFSFQLACPKEEIVPVERFVRMAKNDVKVHLIKRNTSQ